MIEANLYLKVLMVTLALCHNGTLVFFIHATYTYEVNIANFLDDFQNKKGEH